MQMVAKSTWWKYFDQVGFDINQIHDWEALIKFLITR